VKVLTKHKLWEFSSQRGSCVASGEL